MIGSLDSRPGFLLFYKYHLQLPNQYTPKRQGFSSQKGNTGGAISRSSMIFIFQLFSFHIFSQKCGISFPPLTNPSKKNDPPLPVLLAMLGDLSPCCDSATFSSVLFRDMDMRRVALPGTSWQWLMVYPMIHRGSTSFNHPRWCSSTVGMSAYVHLCMENVPRSVVHRIFVSPKRQKAALSTKNCRCRKIL